MKYVFVEGTPGGVRQAWARFQAVKPKARDQQPHVIPAMGGCFVALLEDTLGLADWSARLWFSGLQTPNAANGTIESFARFVRRQGLGAT